jgi:hypothetical protein
VSRFRTDVPASARASAAASSEQENQENDERRALHRLWRACVEAVGRTPEAPVPAAPAPVRHRDWIRAVHGIDTDAWIHPPLIRFLAGYLDQGLAHWAMPYRSRGIHGCFLEIYRSAIAAQCGPWARTLPALVAEDRAAGRDALDSIADSLAQLGVVPGDTDECRNCLSAERWLCAVGPASCVRSRNVPIACRRGTSR